MSQLYIKDGVVIATHDDSATVPPSTYGDGVLVVPVANYAPPAPAPGLPLVRTAPTPTSALLISAIGAQRYYVETKGITVSGMAVATDRESQARVNGAYNYTQLNPTLTLQFKTSVGFVTLTADQVKAVAQAVAAHVQACFALEGASVAAVTAGTITTWDHVAAIVWPTA